MTWFVLAVICFSDVMPRDVQTGWLNRGKLIRDSLHCRAVVSQSMRAAPSRDGTPSAGHVEELHRPVRLCKQGHCQPPSGGPHHQPQRTCYRGTTQHPGSSESYFVTVKNLTVSCDHFHYNQLPKMSILVFGLIWKRAHRKESAVSLYIFTIVILMNNVSISLYR